MIFWTHQTKIKNLPRSETKFLLRGQKSPHQNKFGTGQAKIKNIFIGPFVEGAALKQTLKTLRKVFPYRSCRVLPKRPCLWYQIGRCLAPCLLKSELAKQISLSYLKMKNECRKNAKNLIKILQGKKKEVLRDLKKEMKKASDLRDFEKAAKIRDRIGALNKVISHAKILEEPLAISEKKGWSKTQKEFQGLLKTKSKFSRIEAYDISHIQGQQATGSMVTFINGQADKNFYRKFKIKYANSTRSAKASRNANVHIRIEKPNDIAMIKEVLTRRLKHKEWPYPDLILIDGGKAQLNAARQCLKWRFKHVKVVSLAKKKNELFIGGQKKPVLLKTLPREIFNLILQLRDEAHRFAISYHRKLRKKELIE